jgi:DNA-binding CsgD family transcriptional regulator
VSGAFRSAFGITQRESEVVSLISQGLSNQEIADRLHVSLATVRTHIYNVFQKTGAGSRVDLLRLASGFRE